MFFMHTIHAMTHAAALAICLVYGGMAFGADPLLAAPAQPARAVPPPATPDPLAGSMAVAPGATGHLPKGDLASILPPRTDSPADWYAGVEPLHNCGEPRLLPPCVPPPPCHPSFPPEPYDLVGVDGMPTSGPRYRGPCCPRTGTHDNGSLPRVHRLHDRAFDWFYRTK